MKQQILLIDDDTLANFIHCHIIKSKFPTIPIVVFENGLKALNHIQHNTSFSYLIFLDINMPVMNGWELLKAVSAEKETSHLHIHLLTSSINSAYRQRAEKHPLISSYLFKPLKLKDISHFTAKSF